MKNKELALLAVKTDAKSKLDEKIFVGYETYTYKQVLEGLENGDKKLYKLFIKPLERELKRNKGLKEKLMANLELE